MTYEDNTFISGGDAIFYPGILRSVTKSSDALSPIFEALTNSLEAIRDKQSLDQDFDGDIVIKIYQSLLTDGSTEFARITIQDNGKGFDDLEFGRFNRYQDFSKGYNNRGSGRIQFVHFFESTILQSTYYENKKHIDREFVVSKNEEFLKKNNALVKHIRTLDSDKNETGTLIIFKDLLDKSNATYHTVTDTVLKNQIIARYMQYFCVHKENLPSISVGHYIQGELKSTSFIDSSDVPDIDKETEISLSYYRYDGASFIEIDDYETFKVKSYKAEKSILSQNKLRLTSKDEIVDGLDIELSSLSKNDLIDNSHFLFLVSSKYIDTKDSDVRGEISIPKKKELSNNQANLFEEENIYLDDISIAVNSSINKLYPEFEATQKKHQEDFDRLKKMFLVDDSAASEAKISLNDNDNKVLEKIYSYEAKKVAKLDANLKERIEHLNELDTTSDSYTEELRQEIESLTKDIPQQNKIALTKYVARRKLVLDLFQKILDQSLKRQVSGNRNFDEKLLHNLIFQQSNTDPNKSDLWLINEEFIYFKGSSEERLTDVKINGTPLLRKDLSEEEQKHRKSLDEDRYTKRPDVLLFPEESKCIIIEFKNPDVNASDHLLQINNYASLIWNFSTSEHQFTTFYGYLIGEKLSNMDVQSKDSDFQVAYGFDYLFRPYKPILGFFDKERDNAHLYTEVIRYSTLLKRAKKRNHVFIENLTRNYGEV